MFCQNNGKLLKGFKQRSDMIPFLYIKFTLAAVENGYRVYKNKGRITKNKGRNLKNKVTLTDQKNMC